MLSWCGAQLALVIDVRCSRFLSGDACSDEDQHKEDLYQQRLMNTNQMQLNYGNHITAVGRQLEYQAQKVQNRILPAGELCRDPDSGTPAAASLLNKDPVWPAQHRARDGDGRPSPKQLLTDVRW